MSLSHVARGAAGPVLPSCGIELIDVAKTFGRGARAVQALRSLTFSVRPGQVFGLLGPNGAGKTTTIRILATLARPSAGTAIVAGYDVVRQPQLVRRVIGVANQEIGLDLRATGRELLTWHARLWAVPDPLKKAEELLQRFGLTEAGDRPVRTYSGGMRRRLDLAVALVHAPKVLLLDEPTTGLDPVSRRTVWDEVRRLREEEGLTVLLTTQYLDEADRLADRVAILDQGRIMVEGSPDDLKRAAGNVVAVALDDPGQLAEALHVLPGAEVLDDELRLTVRDGPEAVARVVTALVERQIRVRRVSFSRPTLEDVYLSLTRQPSASREPPTRGEGTHHARHGQLADTGAAPYRAADPQSDP